MLSYHVARGGKHFHAFRHRVMSRLPRTRRSLLLLFALSAILLFAATNFPVSLVTLHTIRFHAFRPYTPRLLSSSFSPPPLLSLSLPDTDIDRAPGLRKYYEDALTVAADHSSVYSPAEYPELDWSAVAEDDAVWEDDSMPARVLDAIDMASPSSSVAAAHRHALLSSLLRYQFHPDTPSCTASSRYLLYSFSSEFSAISHACMSTKRLASLQKPPHRNANKVSSVREIIEAMEKLAKLREKLRQGKKEEREDTDVEDLSDECRLSVIVDVVRALMVAQASRRELVLLPVQKELCSSPIGEGAGMAGATWMGCAWPSVLVRPSRCGWSEVKRIVDDDGYHEDPFSDSAVAVFRSLDHCYSTDAVFQRLQATLADFYDASASSTTAPSRIGRLPLFQGLTRFLLTPAAPLQLHIERTQRELFNHTSSSHSSSSSKLIPSLSSSLSYYVRHRASKDALTLGYADHPLLMDFSQTLVHHTAITGTRDVFLWLEGDIGSDFLPAIQRRLPHLHLHRLHSPTANLSALTAAFASSLAQLLLLGRGGGGLLLNYGSPVGQLLRQLREEDEGGLVVDVQGDEWFHDCNDFSWHFYRAHTHDVAVQRQEAAINAVMYPALPPSSSPSPPSSAALPSVQLLVLIGVSDLEIGPFSSMFDALACSSASPPYPPLTAHSLLSVLLQRMFNSPQTVDDYVQARMDFEAELEAEVARLRAAPQLSSAVAPVIRVDFVPWNVNRPFRDVLKADCAMIARFLESLQSWLPVHLRLLIITREPPSVLYTGTKTELAQLPSGMQSEWQFFFVARVLHDHISALIAEVKAIDSAVYHVVNVDDAAIRTGLHAQQLAAFIDRPACAKDIFRHLRQAPSPLLDVLELTREDFTVNEAAGGFDILSPLKYHGLFERAPSYSWTMEALTNHSALAAVKLRGERIPALRQDELATRLRPVSRAVDDELRLHVRGQQARAAGSGEAAEESSPAASSVVAALDALHPQTSSLCADQRFLVFDLFLRSAPCQCAGQVASSPSAKLDDPPIAEAVRALGRTLSLALTADRTVLIPQFPSSVSSGAAVNEVPLAFLAALSSAVQPLSNCSLADAALKLSCHCASSTWLLSPLDGVVVRDDDGESDAIPDLSSAFDSDRVVVGHARDFHFGWLLRHNERLQPGQQQLSSYHYVSAIHSYLFTCLSRHDAIMSHLSSYRERLSSDAFAPSTPTLAFSLPRSDLYTVSTYVGLIKRLMVVYGFHQLYLTASCSLLYQHQHEDSETGSRPPSCAELRQIVRAIQAQLLASQRRYLQFHPTSTIPPLSIVVSPRLGLSNDTSTEEALLLTLGDIWYTAQCHHVMTTHASEEGMLLSELALQQQLHSTQAPGRSRLISPPLYDLFGHTWLDGMLGSSFHHLMAYAALATSSRAFPSSDVFTATNASAVLLPLPSPRRPQPPSVVKTVFSDALRFIFIAGIEGAGHHFFESALGGTLVYSPWNPVGRANISRVKSSEGGTVSYEDKLPNDPDVLGDGGRIDGEERSASASPGLISHPHFMLDLPLTRTVYEIFVHDSVDAYIDSRGRLIRTLRELKERHAAAPSLPEGVPHHPKRSPVLYPINHLGVAFGMHSYPNMFGADKMMHHPYLPTLATIMEEAGVDFRVLLTVRAPQACHWSTVRRHHGEEVGSEAAYMFQARGLHDNLAYLDGDMRAMDPAFVLQMHLTDVTRDPFRYAVAIADHVGIERRAVQTSLLQLSHSFAVQPDGAWRSALNSSQLIAMKDAFDSAPMLSIFKHRYDALRHASWGQREHTCRAPHALKRRPRLMRRRRSGSEGRGDPLDVPSVGVTLVSLEGSGDWMLRWVVEQLTGYMTGSVHGDSTPGSKSDTVPRVLTSSMGKWTERGELLLVSQRHCAFHCPRSEEAHSGDSSRVEHPPIAVYQPVQWATRLAPKPQRERDLDKEEEVQRRDDERIHLIELIEGPGAGKQYPLARKLKEVAAEDDGAAVIRPWSGADGNGTRAWSEEEVVARYAGDAMNDLIVLYRHPVDVAINLASLTLSNHHLHSEASRVSLNPIWSRWWKNSMTKQAQALLQLTLPPIAHQYAAFLKRFPYKTTRPAHPARRVLYVRYEDLFLHTSAVITQLLAFLRVEVTEGRRRCVEERLRTMQVGVKVSVCSAGCGVASDAMEDDRVDEVERGHGRGLRVLSGLVEEATPTYPFKWLDLIEEAAWRDTVEGLTGDDSATAEMLAQLGYLDSTREMEEYVNGDPSETWARTQRMQRLQDAKQGVA